ncbi:MAG: IS66 family insertion sequence hypothetical protein [Chloroflexota bacterium]
MFGFGPATRIYLAAGATDLRKGFDGLYGLVRDRFGAEPTSGHVFLFANRQRTRLKLLVFDGTGLWVCAKRLERGRFRWPTASDSAVPIVLTPEEMALLLGGIDLTQTKLRPWYRQTLHTEQISS